MMGVKGSDIIIAKYDGIVVWSTIVVLVEFLKCVGFLYVGIDDGNF